MKPGVEILARMLTMTAQKNVKLLVKLMTRERGLREVAFSNRKVCVIKEKCNTVKKGSLIMKGEEKRGNVS